MAGLSSSNRCDRGGGHTSDAAYRRLVLLKEFKEFAMKGNVIDMAVGIVIGGAFGAIVASFVADIIMPLVGLLTGGVDFSDKVVVLKEAVGETPAVTLNYGVFITHVVSFLIVAFAIFMVVKAMNKMKKQEEEAPAAPPAPLKSEVLLEEIRDALRASR